MRIFEYFSAKEKKAVAAVFAVFLLAVFLAYGSVLGGAFIWDDKTLIEDNALITGPFSWGRVFGAELYEGGRANYYRPLLTLSLVLNGIFSRRDPFGYHLGNLLLHFFVGCLAYLFLRRLTGRSFLSFAAVLIFLVHPVHGQVVSYISGRADSLVALFIFLSLLLYARPGAAARAGSVLCFILCLLAKESAIIFPVVLAGWEACVAPAPKGRLRRLMPFFAAGAGYAVLRMTAWNFAVGHPILSKAGFAVFEIGPLARLFLFGKSLLIYLGSFFMPVGLHMERLLLHETVGPASWLGVGLATAVIVLSSFVLRKGVSSRRWALFFVFWFFVWLLPQSAFVFPKIMAEHFLYLPALALCFFLASLLDRLRHKGVQGVLLASTCLALGLLSWENNRNWMSEGAFFEHTVRYAPRSIRARDSLAALYLESGRFDEAHRHYRAILVLDQEAPARSMLRAAVYYNLGLIYERTGKIPEALGAYGDALILKPDMVEACNNAGLLLQRMGRFGEAEALFKRAMAAQDDYCPAYNNLAQLYAGLERMEEAQELWRTALSVCPDYEIARRNLEIAEKLKDPARK